MSEDRRYELIKGVFYDEDVVQPDIIYVSKEQKNG